MRKKLTVAVPILAVFLFIAVAGTITIAGSNSSDALAQTQALETQKKVVLEAITQKDQEKADAEFNIMMKQFHRNKNMSQAIYDIARSYNWLDRKKAVQIHRDNISIYPDSLYSMWSQVEIFTHHFYSGDSKSAEEDVNTLIDTFGSQPGLPKELYQIACKYNQAGKRTKAKELYALAAQLSPDDLYVQLSKLFTDSESKEAASSVSLLTEMMEKQLRKESLGPDDAKLAKEIYNAAVQLGYAGEHENAINCYQQVIDTWPDSGQAPYALQRMAIEYSKLGDEYNATQTINKLIKDYNDFPKKAETFWKLGQYYREEANMYSQAAEYYEYAANNSPKDDVYTLYCQVELVKYYIRTDDITTADEQFDKLTTEFSENQRLASNICFIGDTYLRAGEIDTAESLYNDVLKKWPDDPQTIFAVAGQAKVAASLGQDTDAIKIVDEILSDYTDNPDIGKAILSIGEHYYNEGLEIYKGDTPYDYDENTSAKEESNNNFTNSLAIWLRIIEAIENNTITADYTTTAEYYHYAGTCNNLLGDYETAIEYYEMVINNWPEYKMAGGIAGIIPSIYERMRDEGLISGDSAEKLIIDTYQMVLDRFPNSPGAKAASDKIYMYNKEAEREKLKEQNKLPSMPLFIPSARGGAQ